ncbi:ATPase/histidine kinase/DNA gyrase B/HSP90 domain protein [delta proteobacterium NaphS2]|nr:ATPase/histidine kinase/DNA gyrase B/HSP90 domain protein [delta proteobacterium NaphS2]
MAENRHRIPLWLANLFVFALLFMAVTGYFFWQSHQARNRFLTNVQENAVLVAEIIQLSARGSVLSKKAVEEIFETFLGNTARFIGYLDKVEPFTSEELTAFAAEAGLAGIRIHKKGRKDIEGPPEWLPPPTPGCGGTFGLEYAEKKRLYLFSLPTQKSSGCVMVGITDKQVRIMQESLGLKNVIRTISEIPRVHYVRVETPDRPPGKHTHTPAVEIKVEGNSHVAEARVPMDDKTIAVALNADYLTRTVNRIWRNFFLFSAALAVLGTILSMILYRYQSNHLTEVKEFERRLSAERENASLGRAAAAIAHEIRNPLNTLGMGLQRLQLEGSKITADHQRLIHLMLDAVTRANSSVQGLLKYARPRKPEKKPVRLDLIAGNILQFYARQCESLGITVHRKITFKEPIPADPDLLGQVILNLMKNAVESQPEGGGIHLAIEKRGQQACLSFKNKGFLLKPEEANRILDPYFTTKTDGTGLGLTISRRIVEAHEGHMSVQVLEKEMVEIAIYLPLTGADQGTR